MTQKKQPPGSLDYFTALQQILQLQTDVLTRVLPHSGERGSNAEEYFKAFLRRTLPHRYSIGTGFMICSDPSVPQSRQTDIVIFDEFENSPLFRELAASVFPIEIVYAAIEVKNLLQSKDLPDSVDAISRIRRLGKEKRYIDYGFVDVGGIPGGRLLEEREYSNTLAPRTFVVAYDTEYTSIDSFVDAWENSLSENRDAHLHGCAVLSRNWYVAQFPFEAKASLLQYEDNALARFLSGLLTGVFSIPMKLTDMKRYFRLEDDVSTVHTDPTRE